MRNVSAHVAGGSKVRPLVVRVVARSLATQIFRGEANRKAAARGGVEGAADLAPAPTPRRDPLVRAKDAEMSSRARPRLETARLESRARSSPAPRRLSRRRARARK
eukprot:30670-Pelagococcus_subviridis.AAC.7